MSHSFLYSSGDFEDFFESSIDKYTDSRTKTGITFIVGNFFEEFTSFLKRRHIKYMISSSKIPARAYVKRREIMAYKQITLIHPSDDEDEDFVEFVLKCIDEKTSENVDETITLFKTSIREYILSNSTQDYVKRFSSKRGTIISHFLSERNIFHVVERVEGFDDVVICIPHETLHEM